MGNNNVGSNIGRIEQFRKIDISIPVSFSKLLSVQFKLFHNEDLRYSLTY